jgi:hypothetical protein
LIILLLRIRGKNIKNEGDLVIMDTRTLADSIIKDIKKIDVLGSTTFGGEEMKDVLSDFYRIYDQANTKAFVLNVPTKTKFRFLKYIIGRLIRTHTYQQMEFNYKIMELIKAQQMIILKNMKILEEFISTNDNGK